MRDDCATGHYIVNTYAPQFQAAIACVEHRFYGPSQPFPAMTNEALKLLTSQQALADFAAVGTWLKQTLSSGPLIAFGGSYSGSLSAWFRLKYPNLARII